ncbi:MAG: hypothetical protein JSS66_18615 [Armatimonadetes bacterium]|nr:hypothetical protein [Armatimonadota bacterium]
MRTLPLLATCLLVTSVAHAANLRSSINSMASKVHATFMKKDADAFAKVVRPAVTSDFKYVENGKTMTFDEMVEGMRQGLAQMSKITSATTKILTLTEKGNMGSTTEMHTMSGVNMGQDKKMHKMTFSGKTKCEYRKVKGTWKMASMTWVSQTMTMDGKKMDPSKMGG